MGAIGGIREYSPTDLSIRDSQRERGVLTDTRLDNGEQARAPWAAPPNVHHTPAGDHRRIFKGGIVQEPV